MDATIRPFERTCPRCGLVFLSQSADGLCPACLLTNTLDLEDSDEGPAFWEEPAAKPAAERMFSHFDLLDELGRGGMGVVYRARDLNTERIVAVKVLQAHHLQEADVVKRFRSEVRAVSSLDHPHILPIHEVGEDNAIPFFSMKLTTAGSLAQNLGRYLGHPREAAQLLAKVARGVQHAHERGILHRDLKPGNILIDAAGEPYVADFGLAKWIDDDRNLTMTAAVLGTPHYIAPEQASGSKALTTAVDIYSLGAILYELLTGRPPFVGTSVLETLMASRKGAPERPSSLTAHVPRDLETICLKALQLEPRNRYATAGAFADDLENWLAGRTIQARPANAAEQLWRWARRNPLPASLGAALMTAITVLAVGAVISAVHIDRSLHRAVVAEADARQKLHQSLLDQAHAWRLTGLMGQRVEALKALAQAVQISPDLTARNDAIAVLTLPDAQKIDEFAVREYGKLGLAFDSALERIAVARQNHGVEILDLKTKKTLQTLSGAGMPVRTLRFVTDTLLAGSTANDRLYLWDTAANKLLIDNANVHTGEGTRSGFFADPAGHTLAVASTASGLNLYDTATGQVRQRIPSSAPVYCGAFNTTGERIAFIGEDQRNLVRIYNLADGGIQEIHTPFNVSATTLAWGAEDRFLAIGCIDARTYVWDLANQSLHATLNGHRQDITQVVFAKTDRLIVTTALDGSIRFWDVDSGSEQLAINEYGVDPVLQLSRDGSLLATTDFTLDAALFKIVRSSRSLCATLPPDMVNDWAPLVSSVDFSPDSGLLAVASFTGIRLFDTASRVEVAALPLTERQECGIRFVDAAHLIVATRKEGLRRFTIEKHRNDNAAARREEIRLVDPVTIDPTPGYILGSPSPNAAVVALTSAREGKVRLFDLKSQRTLATIDQLPGVWDYVISPRGWEAASYADVNNMDVAVFSAKTHKLLHPLNAGRSGTLTVSADGRELITTGERGCLVWNVETGAPSTDTPLNLAPAGRSAYTRDGRFFATCADAPIQIYKAQTHELVATLEVRSPPGSSFRLRFSPNGRYLAAQASNNFIQLWDLVELNQALAPLSLNWQ
jgi:WD40 repeat protein